jgi:hypothetical protein
MSGNSGGVALLAEGIAEEETFAISAADLALFDELDQ